MRERPQEHRLRQETLHDIWEAAGAQDVLVIDRYAHLVGRCLLTNEHQRRPASTLTDHGLRGRLVEVAGPAGGDGAAQIPERWSLRNRGGGSIGHRLKALPVR
jgi:hypothetical protein